MKVRKNLEAVFLAAAVIATFATYATAAAPTYRATKNAQLTSAVADARMQVVVIKGKRLTAVEKAQLN